MRKGIIVWAAAIVMVPAAAHAEIVQSEAQQELSHGIELHDAVQAGEGESAQSLVELWIEIEQEYPEPLVWAYLGSSWNLLARDAENVFTKVEGVEKAIGYLDRAVQAEPDNLVIRRIRYENYLELPDFFEQDSVVEEDLDFLIGVFHDSPERFEGVYDPAHVLFARARWERRQNRPNRAMGLARSALRMSSEDDLESRIRQFLGETI